VANFDLQTLKERARRAVEKQSWAKAAELYLEIAPHDDDPSWRQRAGEALRKSGRVPQATQQLALAAQGYARKGMLLQAIAVCKTVLQLDPSHTATQKMLTELYAQRDRSTRTSSGKLAVVAAPPPVERAPVPEPAPAPPDLADASTVSIDDLHAGPPRLPALRPGAPMDVLPLGDVLGFRQLGSAAASHEIELGDEDLMVVPGDESSPRLEPLPPAERDSRPPAAAPARDELDFSGLMDDAPPPAPRRPQLDSIPLFSSLEAGELRRLIEGVEVRDFAAGEIILRQGDPGGSLFVVVEGEVDVLVEGPPRRRVATLGARAFFGELGLITDFPRSATVQAKGAVQCLEISRELMAGVIANSPEVLRTILRFFRDRMVDRLLATSPLFTHFSAEDARTLAGRFKFLELEAKTRVIHEGKPAPGLFMLLCGELMLVRSEQPVVLLTPGELFGAMSPKSAAPAKASADTRSKCWVLELEREDFEEILLKYPALPELLAELEQAIALH
jgi:cAMP-dependent protein kinase regulator